MEELILLALAEIGGFIFNAILYFPWDMLMAVFEEKSRKPIYIVAIIMTILAAAILAKLSVWIMDEPIIRFGWARLVNLCLAPFVAGYIALRMSRRRGDRGKESNSKFHYIVAFVFTLTFIGTRYVSLTG